MGEAASPAVPELIKVSGYQDLLVRRGAVIALGQIGSDANSAVPTLEKIEINDPVPSVRDAARESIDSIKSDAAHTLTEWHPSMRV